MKIKGRQEMTCKRCGGTRGLEEADWGKSRRAIEKKVAGTVQTRPSRADAQNDGMENRGEA